MVVKWYRRLLSWLHIVAAVSLLAATALTCVNAVTRYTLGFVIFGSEELSSYLVMSMVFLVFPSIEARGIHLSVDVFDSVVKSQRIKTIALIFRGIIISGMLAILVQYVYRVTAVQIRYSAATSALRMPSSIFFSVMMLSFALGIVSWVCIIVFNKRSEL